MDVESWRVVDGWSRYEVSNWGRVRNVRTGLILATPLYTSGYPQANLLQDGRKKRLQVHRLVAIAFISPPPFLGAQVNHKDGVKTNNVPDNLEWVTDQQNKQHAKRLGLVRYRPVRGEEHGNARVTAADVFEMRRLRGLGMKYVDIAQRFGLTPSAVSDNIRGKRWRHLPQAA